MGQGQETMDFMGQEVKGEGHTSAKDKCGGIILCPLGRVAFLVRI